MQTIEQLEQANDEAVRAREAAADARLRATVRGATAAEAAALQAEVDRTATVAREAQSALRAAYSALDLGSMGEVCPVNRARGTA